MVWMAGIVLLLLFAFAGFACYYSFIVLHSINNTIALIQKINVYKDFAWARKIILDHKLCFPAKILA